MNDINDIIFIILASMFVGVIVLITLMERIQ